MPVRSCMHTQPFLCRVDLKNKTDRLRLACINWHACSSDSRNCKLYACAYVRPDWLVWNKGNQRLCSDAHECCFVWAHQPGLRPSNEASRSKLRTKQQFCFLQGSPAGTEKQDWDCSFPRKTEKQDCLFQRKKGLFVSNTRKSYNRHIIFFSAIKLSSNKSKF